MVENIYLQNKLSDKQLVKNNTRSSPFFNPIKMDERFVQVLQENTKTHDNTHPNWHRIALAGGDTQTKVTGLYSQQKWKNSK